MGWAIQLRRKAKKIGRTARETRMFAGAMASPSHPILAQIVPIRRCNLACSYCNEFDKTSPPVPLDEMLARIDHLARLGTSIVTISGGEPTLHPGLDAIIKRIRSHGAIATLITNGYFLTPGRIRAFNAAGLDYLQISIDNVQPDTVSLKSLKVLDRKLQWLAENAEFDITINSVLGSGVARSEDAYDIAVRARQLGFTSTVGVIHDQTGQLVPLDQAQRDIHSRILHLGTGLFSFAHFDRFQQNIVSGEPNNWHCRAGGRFLYICEDGLVHYCSQRRGEPGIPLRDYTLDRLRAESARRKDCEPFCTISCVHQVAMLDSFHEHPGEALKGIIDRRRHRDPAFQPPALVQILSYTLIDSPARGFFRALGRRLLANSGGRRSD